MPLHHYYMTLGDSGVRVRPVAPPPIFDLERQHRCARKEIYPISSVDVARVLWKSVGITCLPAVDDSTSSRGLRPVLG